MCVCILYYYIIVVTGEEVGHEVILHEGGHIPNLRGAPARGPIPVQTLLVKGLQGRLLQRKTTKIITSQIGQTSLTGQTSRIGLMLQMVTMTPRMDPGPHNKML